MKKILNTKEVMAISGLSRATLYRRMNDGTFPKSMTISKGRIGWREEDIEKWRDTLRPAA